MAVQDDRRELEIIDLLGLTKPDEGRSGTDATHTFADGGKRITIPIELKSTTGETISTARDVGPDHIAKWRSRYWIIGFYDKGGNRLHSLLPLGPIEMEPWIKSIEGYILPDFAIASLVYNKLNNDDMIILCEDKPKYGIEDAKRIHKRQWSSETYVSEMDLSDGYSQGKMTEIVRKRAQYLIERGATLNNPHITSSFLSTYSDRRVDANQLIKSSSERERFLRLVESDWKKSQAEKK